MDLSGIDHGRRRALTTLGALGTTTLAGCCLPAALRRDHIPRGDAPVGAAFLTVLDAAPLARTLPVRAIDVHTHFFNASDASVVGYLVHSMGHTTPPAVQRLLIAMQPVLNALIGIAPTAADEYRQLQTLAPHMQGQSLQAGQASLDELVSARRDLIARELAREMKKQGADRVYLDAKQSLLQSAQGRLSEQEIRETLDPFAMEPLAGTAGVTPRGVIQFMGCMLQERWMNLRTFQTAFQPRGIEAAFGALVDFDHWYRCPARSSMPDQMRLHGAMSRLSGGYMLPLIAYNPWRDIVEDGAALELVKEAVRDHGFIGVKIYPPMGFFPFGNTRFDVNTTQKRPNASQLDARLRALFEWCADNHVPVMAHANRSAGRDMASDSFPEPRGWAALIEELQKQHRSPLVNLGHFGGDGDAVPGVASDTWTIEFSELMARPGGERVYGDIGYWTALRSCARDAAACDTVHARIRAAKQAFPGVGKRLMYGSDWFMMIKEADWQGYPADLAAALVDLVDLDDVFHRNALGCFGLGKDGPNVARIANYLGMTPEWMGRGNGH